MSTGTERSKKTLQEGEAMNPHPHRTSRQRLSSLGKLTVGGLLLGTFLCGSIAIALTFVLGAPSVEILLETVGLLIGAGLVATRIRWAPLVGTLVSGMFLFILVHQPFVVSALTGPKDPADGGFPPFVVDVIIIAAMLMTFVASIGALIQNYRQDGRQMPRWFLSFLNILVGMIIGAILIGSLAPPPVPAGAGTTYTNGVPTVHMGPASFLQPSVTITKGSKLLLVADRFSVHILDNGSWQNNQPHRVLEPGEPVLNNVQVSGNSVEIGPFTTAGTFHIYCTVHRGMNLTIIVQ